MNIHVVSSGETLRQIGNQYQVAPEIIANLNGLNPPYSLVVGQSLLVRNPAIIHVVTRGESLYTIAKKQGTTTLEILRNNPQLGGLPTIAEGDVLVIAYSDDKGPCVEVNGYAYPYVDTTILRGILPYSTTLTPFTYAITELGDLVPPDKNNLIQLAKQYGVRPLMHLTNLINGAGFSSDLASIILNSPTLQNKVANLVVAEMVAQGYEGLDVDFEYVYPEDGSMYTDFVSLLREKVNQLGYEVTTALAPKFSDNQMGLLYESHDYQALGAASDGVFLMTYEWGYTYGPPMAVAPIGPVTRVLEYALSKIPSKKILLGFPNYGYDWTLPFVGGESKASSISNPDAVALALKYGAEIQFDPLAQSPYFFYTDEENRQHEVWFEDVRSAYEKFKLIETYDLRGVGYWNYMRPFVSGFSLQHALFQSKKNC